MNTRTFAARRERLKEKVGRAGLSALLVRHAANRFYLSGFELHDPQCNESAGMLVISAEGDDWLLTDARYLDAARAVWPEERVHIYNAPQKESIRDFLAGLGLAAIGFEEDNVSFSLHRILSEKLTLRPAPRLVEQMRLIKDEDEIRRMRHSCALNHKIFELTPEILRPGKTEAQVAWQLEQAFRNAGASELSFATIVGVGPNAALPHAIPGSAQVRENELVLVDMGCRLDDYCSDQTRTFWVGDSPSDRFTRTLAMVREAQEAALRILKPGLPIAEAYRAARAAFESHGVAANFTHGLGHGIGLETHEGPSLAPRATAALEPGMVVTVEPGLYWSDWGGIRWEYMVLITPDGSEIL